MPSQRQGFLVRLDALALRPLAFFEQPFAMVQRLEELGDRPLLSQAAEVIAYDAEDGARLWAATLDAEGSTIDFAIDPERDEILLSDGRLLACEAGEPLSQLTPLGQ